MERFCTVAVTLGKTRYPSVDSHSVMPTTLRWGAQPACRRASSLGIKWSL